MPSQTPAEALAEALAKQALTPEHVADMQRARYDSVAHAQWRQFVAQAEDWLTMYAAYEEYIGK